MPFKANRLTRTCVKHESASLFGNPPKLCCEDNRLAAIARAVAWHIMKPTVILEPFIRLLSYCGKSPRTRSWSVEGCRIGSPVLLDSRDATLECFAHSPTRLPNLWNDSAKGSRFAVSIAEEDVQRRASHAHPTNISSVAYLSSSTLCCLFCFPDRS